jgi:outer membrane biogenesis lipoprotein LolB
MPEDQAGQQQEHSAEDDDVDHLTVRLTPSTFSDHQIMYSRFLWQRQGCTFALQFGSIPLAVCR